MKIFNLLILLIPFQVLSQSKSDSIIFSSFVGDWEHVQSIYPSGNKSEYYREFNFYSDGTGLCWKIYESDTLGIPIVWEVKDTCIFIYNSFSAGSRTLGDIVFVSHLDEENFFGDKVYGEAELRKTSYYHRKDANK